LTCAEASIEAAWRQRLTAFSTRAAVLPSAQALARIHASAR
jgi:hypothetical protein